MSSKRQMNFDHNSIFIWFSSTLQLSFILATIQRAQGNNLAWAFYCFLSEFANNFFYKNGIIGQLYNNNPSPIPWLPPHATLLTFPHRPSSQTLTLSLKNQMHRSTRLNLQKTKNRPPSDNPKLKVLFAKTSCFMAFALMENAASLPTGPSSWDATPFRTPPTKRNPALAT